MSDGVALEIRILHSGDRAAAAEALSGGCSQCMNCDAEDDNAVTES